MLNPRQRIPTLGFLLLWLIGAAGCGSSGFDSGPTVASQSVTALSPKDVTLAGKVNPNGEKTTVWFEWGTSDDFANKTPCLDIGSGVKDVTVTHDLVDELQPDQVYLYRIVARNSLDISYGATKTLTTPPVPLPAVVTVAASAPASATPATASCSWSASVNSKGFATTGWFEWWLDPGNKQTTEKQSLGSGDDPVPLKDSIDGTATPNTTYHYRAVSQNEGGVAFGEEVQCTTPPPPSPPPPTDPPAISDISVTGITPTSTALNASINPQGSTTLVWFEWWRDGSTTVNNTNHFDAGNGGAALDHNVILEGLDPDTLYHFRIIADGYGEPVSSAVQTFRTAFPPAVGSLAATGLTPSSASLNAQINPNGFETSAWFEWGVNTSYGNKTAQRVVGNGTVAVDFVEGISNLAPDTQYHFRLVMRGHGGVIITGSDRSFRTKLLPSVSTDSATAISPTSASLAGDINPNGFATSVWFEWGADTSYGSVTPEQGLGSGTAEIALSDALTGLEPDTQYHYRAVARGYGGTIITGQDRVFTTDPVPLPAVTTKAPSSVTQNACTLEATVNPNGFDTDVWFERGDDTSYGDTTAVVALGNGVTETPFNTVIGNLSEATTYHYRVVAQNEGGTVQGDDMVCTTLASFSIEDLSVNNITTSSATVTWTTTDSATSSVEYGPTSDYDFTVGDSTPRTSHNFTITGLAPSSTYHYRVVSVDAANNVYTSGDATFTTADAPLTTVNVAQGKSAFASSTYTGYSLDAPLDGAIAQSGDTNLMWAPGSASADEWYGIDFGSIYSIDQVALYMGKNNTAYSYPRAFDIETSVDGVTWETQKGVTNNTQFTYTASFPPVDARYVRFVVRQGSAFDGLSYLVEFEVYEAIFASSGTYTSAIFDTGQGSNFTTVSWTETVDTAMQTIDVKVRTCDDPVCAGEPDFDSLAGITNGDSISTGGGAIDGHRYVQYQVRFTTSASSRTPSLYDITIDYGTGSWIQTQDGGDTTTTSFNLAGSIKTYTQVTSKGGGNIQLSKPPLGGTGEDGAYVCLASCNDLAGGVYNFTSFYIAEGAVVDVPKDGSALVIYSQNDVTINGTLRANGGDGANGDPGICSSCAEGGAGGTAGAGGRAGGHGGGRGAIGPTSGLNGKGTGGGIGARVTGLYTCAGGGGGGGFGGTGGNGVANAGGQGGPTYGIPTNGGSGGGGGCGSTGGGGGGSGGVLRVSSGGNIIIGENGIIQANGGNGGFQVLSGTTYVNDSGGGGSGGGLQLEAITVVNEGVIQANGGQGRTNGTYGSGGGGGGRVNIYDVNGFVSGAGNIQVNGGGGASSGTAGVTSVIVNTNYGSVVD